MIVLTAVEEKIVVVRWWENIRGRAQGRRGVENPPSGWWGCSVFSPLRPQAGSHLCPETPEAVSEPGYPLGLKAVLSISALICCHCIKFCPSSEIRRLNLLLPPPSVDLLWLKQTLQRCPCPRWHTCWHVVICAVFPCHWLKMSWCHSVHGYSEVARTVREPELGVGLGGLQAQACVLLWQVSLCGLTVPVLSLVSHCKV